MPKTKNMQTPFKMRGFSGFKESPVKLELLGLTEKMQSAMDVDYMGQFEGAGQKPSDKESSEKESSEKGASKVAHHALKI